MLVRNVKKPEGRPISIRIGEITVLIMQMSDGNARLGVSAPRNMPISIYGLNDNDQVAQALRDR